MSIYQKLLVEEQERSLAYGAFVESSKLFISSLVPNMIQLTGCPANCLSIRNTDGSVANMGKLVSGTKGKIVFGLQMNIAALNMYESEYVVEIVVTSHGSTELTIQVADLNRTTIIQRSMIDDDAWRKIVTDCCDVIATNIKSAKAKY
jgi:hypothetical protein